MDKKPSLSVVIPAYNEEKYLPSCLESLKNQTYQNFEIIVVDNNSTDKTVAIAREYGAKVISEKRQGISFTRATGITYAQTEIVAGTEADTIAPKDWLEKINHIFTTLPSSVVGISGPLNSQSQFLPSFLLRFLCDLFFSKLSGFFCGHIQFLGPNIALRKSAWEKIRTCQDNQSIFDEFDISCHLATIGEVRFIPAMTTNLSFRKIKENPLKGLHQYFVNYVIRYFRTVFLHRHRNF